MVSLQDSTITMSRGDGVQLNISIDTQAGTAYKIKDTDVITLFLLKEPSIKVNNKPVFTKLFSKSSSTSATVKIQSEDTLYLNGSVYYYTIILQHNDETGAEEYYGKYKETVCYGKLILK